MTKISPFILLDIDSVLLQPHGYRRAYIDSVNAFLRAFGQFHLSTDDEIASWFEFRAIQAEWDMTPLTIAIFLEWRQEQIGGSEPYGSLENAKGLPPIGNNEDFKAYALKKIDAFAGTIHLAQEAAEAVFLDCQARKEKSVLPFLSNDPILREILFDTLNIRHSAPFQMLECFTLGSKLFEEIFGIPAPLQCESNLEIYDSPLISAENRQKLVDLSGKSGYVSIITARPNLFPQNSHISKSRYCVNLPEGECAMRLLGWDDSGITLIGIGGLSYLEEKYGVPRQTFLKPHPMQALAGIFAPIMGNLIDGLEMAYAVFQADAAGIAHDECAAILPKENEIIMAVFEDMRSGVESAVGAAAILSRMGYAVRLEKYGVATSAEKTRKIADYGARIVQNVNDGLDDFFRVRLLTKNSG